MVRLTALYIGAFLFSALAVAFANATAGLAYFVAIVPLIFFTYVVRDRSPFVFTPIVGAALAFYAFYFVRPLMLVPFPELFGYDVLGYPDAGVLVRALLLQGLFSATFLCGLYFALHLGGSKIRVPPGELAHGTMARLGTRFLLILLAVSLVWFFVVFYSGAGQKLVVSRLNVLGLILPTTLIIPACFGFLGVGYLKKLSLLQWGLVISIVASNVMVVLLSGSKAGVFLLVLYTVFYVMLRHGNARINLLKILFLAGIALTAIFASVVLANVVKYSNASAYSATEIFERTVGRSDFWLFMLDRITFRLNGYDGTIAVLLEHPAGFAQVANWPNIILGGLAQLLPGISNEEMSLGKSVGIFFADKPFEQKHAGALGLVGVIYYMHGAAFGAIVCAILGGLFGGIFRLMARWGVRGTAERLTVFLVMAHMQAFWISSGNFDKLIQQLGVSLVHIVFYYSLLRLSFTVGSRNQQTTTSRAM